MVWKICYTTSTAKEKNMAMPRHLVLVRHGESEANVVQQADKAGVPLDVPDEVVTAVRNRPDWMQRLSPHGVRQAEIAGSWILQNISPLEAFDARYSSAFLRARDTIVHMGGAGLKWRAHNMLHERDWGAFGAVSRAEQAELFARTVALKQAAPLYARLDGGEALADSVALRVRDFRTTLRNKWDNKRVIAVAHGDTLSVVRYIFEEMLPEQWHEMDADRSQRLGNCAILEYARENPWDERDVRPYLGWRRITQPDDPDSSPFGGEWMPLPDNRFMTGAQVLASTAVAPRLLFSEDA
jgi:broad specificity phosphatase PhoE